MPSLLSIDVRRAAFEEDPKWRHKAVLRLLAITLALAGLSTMAAAVGLTNANFINTLGAGDWTDGITLAPVSLPLELLR